MAVLIVIVLSVALSPDRENVHDFSVPLADRSGVSSEQSLALPQQEDHAVQPELSSAATLIAPPASTNKRLRVYGVTADEHGLPLPGVVVGYDNFSEFAVSDARGIFQLPLELHNRDNLVLRFLKSGHKERTHTVLVGDDLPQELDLSITLSASDRTVTVTGYLLDEDGNIMAAQPLRLRSGEMGRQYRTYSQPDGSYAFEGVYTGNYDLTVFSQGPYKRYQEQNLTISSTLAGHDIRLIRVGLGVFAGTVLNGEGVALQGITIRAHSSATPDRPHSVVTDETGRFVIQNAAAGLWTVSIRHDGYFRLSNITLSPNAWLNADLVLDIGYYEVSGAVYDAFYNTIPNASIEFSLADKLHSMKRMSRRVASTDDSGTFHIGGLATGNYRINISASGYQTRVLSYIVGSRSDSPQILLQKK